MKIKRYGDMWEKLLIQGYTGVYRGIQGPRLAGTYMDRIRFLVCDLDGVYQKAAFILIAHAYTFYLVRLQLNNYVGSTRIYTH